MYRMVPGIQHNPYFKPKFTWGYFKLVFTPQEGLWHGTTFTFEAGKALAEKVNEAVVTFRPRNIKNCASDMESQEYRNVLRIKFAPEQHICLSMWTKAPGFAFALREQELTLVKTEAEESASPEAYERVLFDCITGDQTRFVSGDEVELAWQFITPILERFKDLPLLTYAPGPNGPNNDN